MCGHYRVAVPSAKLGQPEVALGLVPGAGGTQRLPRLVGVEKALVMVTDGKPISAQEGLSLGLIDALMPEKGLKDGALAFTRQLLADGKGVRRTRDSQRKSHRHFAASFCRFPPEPQFSRLRGPGRSDHMRRSRHHPVLRRGFGVREPHIPGLQEFAAKPGPALCLLRRAQGRRRFRVWPTTRPLLPIAKVGVIGAGLMGGGIATVFANAGLPVTIVEADAAALDKGLGAVKANYESGVKRGRVTAEEAQRALFPHHRQPEAGRSRRPRPDRGGGVREHGR